MLLQIFLFVQIFIVFVYGQNSFDAADVPKIQYILDASTPTLYFDLSILQPNQQLIVATSAHFSIDMFLAGLYPTELKNYLFYEGDTPTNKNLVGSLADEDLFYGNATEWYIPLLYSAKSKALTIVRNNETKTITNSVLFFRIPEVHKCGKHKNVAQPNSKYNYFIEYSITAPIDSICHFTIITFKQRPRRLVIQYLDTDSSESVQISGSTFNECLDYFKFDKSTANDYTQLNLFGSVFTFDIPKSQSIVVSFAGQKDDDHADLNQEPESLEALNVITSPDYGELDSYATLKYCSKDDPCKTTVKNFNKNSWFLFRIEYRDISNSTILYAIDGENKRYDLKTLEIQISHWIRTTNFTIFYSDISLSNYLITYQLYYTGTMGNTTVNTGTMENTTTVATTMSGISSSLQSSSTFLTTTTTSPSDSVINKASNLPMFFITFVVINLL